MKIVILDGYTVNPGDLSWDQLKEFGEFTVYDRTPPELVIERIDDADIIMTNKCLLTKEVLAACPNIKWIGILATGFNNVDLAYTKEHGIPVTNIPAYSTNSVVQLTFSLLLEICNQVRIHSDAVHSGAWQSSEDFCFTRTPQMELWGKTFGIVGFGSIGKNVAKVAEALGMRVLIASKHPDPSFESERIVFTTQQELFAQADVISLHCPLTEENRGLINRSSIQTMKDGVIILNTARGPLINDADLAEALRSGKVAAAGLDVLSAEPPREGSPLFGIPNCIITPHIAWNTKEARSRLINTAVSNLAAFTEGRKLNCVSM
ncbi:D-2-hydroxyacid dehydrogenase [Anoxybacterium hadale]|uniref:D-2-hydroxyacid dehydrogenase n=1 Tax=Anoxybacterium hadale TaxID=3408580 RepID=A0ACD1ADT1_9FIRM|nr:D-2-hydroxyacid dehydrogenase [Clostridiales bacterium]